MKLNTVKVSDLVVSQNYTDVKLTFEQKGVFTEFSITGTNVAGDYTCHILQQDGVINDSHTFKSDGVVFRVDLTA